MTIKLDFIAHYADLDGLLSHVLMEKRFPHQINHLDIKYGEEEKALAQVQTSAHILADIGYSSSKTFTQALNMLKTNKEGGSITALIDHHHWPQEILQDHFHVYELDKNMSTTPLIHQYFPTDKLSKRLALVAYNDDRNQPDFLREPLNQALQSTYPTNKLITHLSKAKTLDELIPQEATPYIEEYQNRIRQAKKDLKNSYEKQHNFITGLASKDLYMKEGLRTMAADHPERDLLCLYENTNQALFTVQQEKDFNKIVTRLPAGGRDNAGGITLPTKATKTNYHALADDIIRAIQ